MELLKILQSVEILAINGPLDIDIQDISYDSRTIKNNSMFICIKGYTVDGHDYIDDAIKRGAKAILVEKKVVYKKDITYIRVEDIKKSMAIIADNFFKNPSQKINLIGVTGTNGKTSTVSFIRQILEYDNKVGSIGTIEIYDGQKKITSKNTTPESLDIQRNLSKMINNGCKYCVMEVSSHALVLNRVDNIDYKIGVFTNLTQDHLDFHKNIDNYKNAKQKLFYKTSSFNIFNIDDKTGEEFFKNSLKTDIKTYTYGIEKEADFRASDIKLYHDRTEYTLNTNKESYRVSIPILGYFNVYNTLAAISTCILLGIDCEEIIKRVLNLKSVPGRLERVENEKHVNIIVDYAHTPDALLNLVESARLFTKGRIILIFGCGGDRDKTKRPIMGKIAQANADISIITSDNPRFENEIDIINDILKGIDKNISNYLVVKDREDAIKKAIEIYQKEDLIIIAGKGHEDYQIKGNKKYFFDDKKIAKEILDKI
ncbi:UDP-N-acetylmuramoyl-L-alanyl-D-glutamate--2,6-diaminopimelate ligase [Intestinibacter bartlettii]|uniref:UDP-N-acetylmuramoyl-L-alanyl-D-glutamate--2,6-diaminopimelate ligase n=1 Tax=Intestinibacter bartlettii TaxID=261299 RepID=A0ABS6DYT0_9FIRM|nr:UDP-N-acetylmuramoyl-L-alanyl-D-glutamate--2,6-diaminopimelate ligase [Intestinibacter bartlettii]MBU5336934.1 UDP-N-acetylmuramoyl-L-alanyl-D-glutamate--2,6-diaminopimelate ligase [Intestinibacter bartlettii]